MERTGKWAIAILLMAGIVLLAIGCGEKVKETSAAPQEQPIAKAETIEAMVPCGQVGPFSEVVKLFEQQHPEVAIEWVPENIVTITQKILDHKATPDLFLSMGDLEMNKVEQAGLVISGTRAKIAANALALTVPADNPAGVQNFADLAKPSVKLIAVADPEYNSLGKHALEAFQKAGLWKQVEKKVIFPREAAEGKEVASQGKVDATIAYYPCVTEVHVKGQPPAKPKNLKLLGTVPAELYNAFWCEGAVIQGSKNPEGGKKLIEFLKTTEAQEIFRKWSFTHEPMRAN